MRAAIYLRISQDATGEALGVARQLEDCTQLAQSLGWDVVDIYTDNDISASSGKARPAYKQMLADIQAGLFDALVIWSPDRLYRRAPDLETLIPIIDDAGIVVRTVKAGDIDLTTAYGRMIARILGAVATGEGEIKSERWRRSWRQGREAGRPALTGTRMFGYTRDSQIIPEEAAIARQMISDILDGTPIQTVARDLEQRGILTTRGSAWRAGTVRQYITNPRIAGWSTLKGQIVAEGDWEPIIDRETWAELTAMTSARTRPYVPRKALLNGLIHCGDCGVRLITGSYGPGRRTYRCPGDRAGWDGCGSLSGMAEPIEQIVEAFAQQRMNDPRVEQRLAELRADPTAKHVEIADLSTRISELEQELDSPGVPVAAILRAIERAQERRATLMAEASAGSAVPIERPTQWPTDLRRRRALVDLTITRVDLLPANRSRGARLGFDNNRVKITPS